MTDRSTRSCAFEGCERPAVGRGYCSAHHKQLMKGGPLKPLRQQNRGKTCDFEGCERPAKARGYCQSHYAQVLRGKEPSKLRYQVDYSGDATCVVEGCERRPVANGLCKHHYGRMRRAWLDELKVEMGCADCGYNLHPAALDFHHMGDDKAANVSHLVLISREAALVEMQKCVLLCANCHKLRHVSEAGR